MHLAMIKPYTILRIRDEDDGSKTVFFRVTKVVQLSDTKSSRTSMESAIRVDAGQDIDQALFQSLSQTGWF